MSSTTDVQPTERTRTIARHWGFFALFGVITIGFGIVLTFRPSTSVHAIAVIFAIWLLIVGILRLVQAIGHPGNRAGRFVAGIGMIGYGSAALVASYEAYKLRND
jgi:uncharacterized membrane protein HdeD (DUF308 family)